MEACLRSRFVLLLLGVVCVAFSSGYQSVALAAWLQPLLVLLYLRHGSPPSSRTWRDWLAVWVAQALGMTVAFAGSFNDPDWKMSYVALVAAASLVVQALIVLVAIGTSVLFAARYPLATHRHLLSVPVLVTGVCVLFSKVSPTGSYAHPAYSQWTLPPVVQLASVFGTDGILFLMTWLASALAAQYACGGHGWEGQSAQVEVNHLQHRPLDQRSNSSSGGGDDDDDSEHGGVPRQVVKERRRHVRWAVGAVLLVLVLGGANMTVFRPSLFYQKTTEQTLGAEPVVRLGCIIGQDNTAAKMEGLWNQTKARAAEGNDFVIWSEEAVTLYGAEEEEVLLSQASAVSREYGVYLGLAYKHYLAAADKSEDMALNIFTLVQPDGTVGFRYEKTHPVPVVERGIIAGTAKAPPVLDTPFGKVSAAICFDLDFPDWVIGAGRAGVDLMLQPSWTWGPIGPLHAYDNAYRAVENGFQLFRCSSGGVSGAITSTYQWESFKYTGKKQGGIDTVALLRYHRRFTLYPVVGFLFRWLCLVLSCVYILSVLLPNAWIDDLWSPFQAIGRVCLSTSRQEPPSTPGDAFSGTYQAAGHVLLVTESDEEDGNRGGGGGDNNSASSKGRERTANDV